MITLYYIKSLKRLLLIGVFSLMSFFTFGQALVDNPCGFNAANQWPLDGTCYNVSTAGFGALFNPNSCNSAFLVDGWGWFVGDGNSITVFFNPAANKDPILHVYDATAGCGAIILEGCSDNCCNNANESVTFASVLGNIYIIRLQDWNSNAAMTGCLSVTTAAPPCAAPGNDNACGATAMPTPLDGTNCLVGETNCGATPVWSGGCVPAGDVEVWYTVTLTGANTTLNLTLTNTTFGGGNVNVLITTKNDICPADANMTLIGNYCGADTGPISFAGLTPGTQYHIGISTNVGNEGNFDICATEITPAVGGSGDDCANADRIACGDPILVGETSVGNTDDQDGYTCHTTGAPFFNPIATPGGDHYYVVQWPDAASGGAIRINLTNVVDGNDTYLELIALGNPCAPPACDDGGQLTIATGVFGTNLNFIEYTVPAGIVDYYFVIDSQNDGIDSYDLEITCFTTGLELDATNGCAPIPAGQPANQGYYQTWDGVAPPATQDPAAMPGTYTICENVYIMNVGWEWLKYFDVTLGACWTNPTNFTPNGANTGFFSLCGGANRGVWNANLAGNVISWDFTHPQQGGCGNTAWGDGNILNNNYSCRLYTFCYDANVDPTCSANTGFQNGISATDDGIGAGAGSGVNPSNITLGTTSPTVLPVTLVSFTAQAVLQNDKYGVVLKWKTAAEINNDFFTIERSTDGIEFEEVLEMPGAGNSTALNNYFAVDEDPYKGISYYRLKQTDFNGAYEYLEVVSVNISNIDDLTLFPNPVTSDLKISLKSKKENTEMYVKIYNVTGSLILEQNNTLIKGLNQVVIDMSEYSQGLYFVVVEYDDKIQKLKFLKD